MKDQQLIDIITTFRMAQKNLQSLGFNDSAKGFTLRGFKHSTTPQDQMQHHLDDAEALELTQEYLGKMEQVYKNKLAAQATRKRVQA